MGKQFDARLIVGDPGGPKSSIWRLSTYKADVYLLNGADRSSKLSFHGSGICRKAFTREFGIPPGLQDRVYAKWKRAKTPPVGSGQGSCVLEIAFPTDFLSTDTVVHKKTLTWIEPAPAHRATVLEMIYTSESEKELLRQLDPLHRSLVIYARLTSGEGFAVLRSVADFPGETFRVPANHHAASDLIFSPRDPWKSGRPIRFTAYSRPCDGDRMTVWEYGGYKATPLDAPQRFDEATFTRGQVFARSVSVSSKT
jgi:hypothetical protein